MRVKIVLTLIVLAIPAACGKKGDVLPPPTYEKSGYEKQTTQP